MRAFRRRTRQLAGLWLALQLSFFVATPHALSTSALGHAGTVECTCGHGAAGHDTCPMHHPQSKSRCAYRSTSDPMLTLVISLLGTAGVIPAATSFVGTIPATAVGAPRPAAAVAAAFVPEPPPPRA